MPPYKIYSPRRPCTRNFASQKQTVINKEIANKLTGSSTDSDNKEIILFFHYFLLLLLFIFIFIIIHISYYSTVLTHQALRIHCSAKNFLTVRHILTLRLLMSYIYIYIYIYIYMEHLFLMFLDHTQRRTTVGRPPAEIVGSNPTGGMDICLL